MGWLPRQFDRLLHWLHHLFKHTRRERLLLPPPTSTSQTYIQQNSQGDCNQIIAQMSGGTAIAKLIQHFHLSPQEILSLESFWQNWSQDTDPPLSPSLVIGGREQERDRIISWLRGSPSPLSLQADSPEEAIAFLAAVVQDLDDEERDKSMSRSVIVMNTTSWQSLITPSEPLVLIARLNQLEGIGQAIKNGHHVFIPLGQTSSDNENRLPRIKRAAAEQALKEMGLGDDKSRSLATLARRSLSALRRKLAIAQNIQQPAWALPNEARVLLAPLLVSAWDSSSEGDRAVLAQLSGLPYEALQAHLVRWANEPDPPLRRVGDIWMIAAQEDAYRLIARYLTDEDLERFETAALDVLSELDPAFELPLEQRFMASIHGKVLKRSGYLRKGISEMLALMATLSSEISFIANRTGQEVARRILRRLMEKAKGSEFLWFSLAYQLPLLAEAAPEILSQEINSNLAEDNPVLVSLFQDKTSDAALTSSSPHTGLLWALETLAWNPDYLSSAAVALARLARLDPGGNLANRPFRSLRSIFICWHPNTTASLKSRLKVLDLIRKQEPEIAWNLLLSLLPERHSSVISAHRTRWRDWVPDSPALVTAQEYTEASNAILERLISDVGSSVARWCSLVVAASGMTTEQQEILLHHLEALDPTALTLEEQVQIFDCLRKETIRHREYSGAWWAMPAEYVQRLKAILVRFEPDAPIYRHRWLFKYGVELSEKRGKSWQENDRLVEGLRKEALQEILNLQGWDGVVQLAQQVKEPGLVGVTLAKAKLLPIDPNLFLRENLYSQEKWRSAIARSYVSVNAYSQGEQWIENCIDTNLHSWSVEEYGEFLLCLPFNVQLLDRLDAANLETQHYFWSRFQRISFLGSNQANRVLAYLLSFGRSHLAADAIGANLKETSALFSPEQIAEVLEAAVQTEPSQNFDVGSFAYHSAELMDYLEKTEISRDRLANLELMYFQIHEHYRYPRTLYDELSKSPELFVEALQYTFRAENGAIVEKTEETDTLDHSTWEFAYKFLESWRQMPGVLEGDSVDAEALRSWIVRVRELAAECGRSKIADVYIGHSLAFSPVDPDGVWPHRAVRDLLEDLENLTIERGWRTQIFNNRGITTRLSTDGGEQERILIEQYRNDAQQIGDQWPRTAAVLREIAEIYRSDAAEQDQRAELTQDFWR